MQMEVTCKCGWQVRGTESEVIAKVQEHGVSVHGLETTPDEVRAIWRPVGSGAASSD